LLTYLLTYLLTAGSKVLLEKLTGSQLVKISPTFYGTHTFITTFTSARKPSLSTWHGAFSGCRRRNGLHCGGWLRMFWI